MAPELALAPAANQGEEEGEDDADDREDQAERGENRDRGQGRREDHARQEREESVQQLGHSVDRGLKGSGENGSGEPP